MGGGHCLICYSLIPNSDTFNSSKTLQNCASLCKVLGLPVKPFRDIFNRSPTCQECANGLQDGAQIIRRFEVLRREINQLKKDFENKLVKAHKLSLDLNDLKGCHKERSSIIKELNLNVNTSEGNSFGTGFEDHDLQGDLVHDISQGGRPTLEELEPVSFTITKRCIFFCPKSHKKWTTKGCRICERPVCKIHRKDKRFCPKCSSKFGQPPLSLPFETREELQKEDHKDSNLIIKDLKLSGEDADTFDDFQADLSPFAQVNMDSPESTDLTEPDLDHQEEIHMSRTEISSLPEIKLFENEDLATTESQNMTLEDLPSVLSDPVDIPGVSSQPNSTRNNLETQSNCITLKVPLLQLVKLPLPRGQTAFKLKDLPSLGINPLQNLPNPTSNLPERIFKQKFACTICFKVCTSLESFSIHSKYFDHTLMALKCCSIRFPTIGRFKSHRISVHGEVYRNKTSYKIKCKICEFRCSGQVQLQDHMNGVHLDLKIYACTWPGCTESFKTSHSLKCHINGFHKNIKPFLCELCPQSCVSLGRLNEHRKAVHEKIFGFFPCKQCTHTFTLERNLRNHINRLHGHISTVRHLCTLCGYELKTNRNLKDHLELHKKKGDKFRPRNRSCWKKDPQGPQVKPKLD